VVKLFRFGISNSVLVLSETALVLVIGGPMASYTKFPGVSFF
jgi:hypothetical protein